MHKTSPVALCSFNARHFYHACILYVLLAWAFPVCAIEVTGSNIPEGQWIDSDATLRIHFNQMPGVEDLRIVVGNLDLTALFRISKQELVFASDVIALPSGEKEIKIYAVRQSDWQEIGSIPIRVRQVTGFDKFEIIPRLDIAVKAQLKEGHSADADPPTRTTYHDLTGQGGIGFDVARGDLSAQLQSNFIGTSYRNEALRFGEKGIHAPKVDLSDYLFALNMGSANLSIGHYQYEGSRYVMPNASNRGISTSYQVGERASVAATAQSTTPVTGYGDAVGMKKEKNRIYGVKVSTEVFERPGALKVEGFYSKGYQLSDPGFNVGAITDAEQSTSASIRISASSPESMLTAEVEGARSSFTNPADPQLDQGFGVVPVNKTKDNAFFARVVFNAYQGQFESGKPLSLSLSYEFERIDPLFKTIGAYAQADSIRHLGSATSMLGDVSINASFQETRDNLDDLTTVLTTKTRNFQVGVSLPVKNMLVSTYPEIPLSFLLPSLNANYNQSHQFGANRPDLDPLSGFAASHIPDQLTKSIDLSASWNGDIWGLNYSYQHSRQDNRQVGRQNADYINQSNNLSGQIQLLETLSINAGVSRVRSVDLDQVISTYTLSRNIGLNWIVFENWTISGNLSTSRIADSLQNASSRSLSADAQLAWQYAIPLFGTKKIPGQAYLRYDRQINDSVNNLFAFQSNVSTWAVLGGFSMSMF